MNKYDEKVNQIIKDLKEYWFKDHVAELQEHGDLKVLIWRRPNSICYYTRYVFDGNKMYISGDIGEAVFNLTWTADIHSFNNISVYYFMEKMRANSDGKYDYDGEIAKEYLLNWKKELIKEGYLEDSGIHIEDILATIDLMSRNAEGCSNEEEWAYEYVNGIYSDFLSGIDCDYWEWIYEIGRIPNQRVYAYLIGLQMASEQLKEERHDM